MRIADVVRNIECVTGNPSTPELLKMSGRNDANGVSHTSLGQAKASPQDTRPQNPHQR